MPSIFCNNANIRVINANLGVKKHMSMIAVPKLLRCYDCDSIIDRKRTQAHCDYHSQVGKEGEEGLSLKNIFSE